MLNAFRFCDCKVKIEITTVVFSSLLSSTFLFVYIRGRLPTAREAKSSGPQPLYQIVVTIYGQPYGIIFYGSALLPHCPINVLCVAFLGFHYEL